MQKLKKPSAENAEGFFYRNSLDLICSMNLKQYLLMKQELTELGWQS